MIREQKLLIIIKKQFIIDIVEWLGHKCNGINFRSWDTNLRPVLEIQIQQKKANKEHQNQVTDIVKEPLTEEHRNEIFSIYKQWINSDFSIDIDLKNFDINNLLITVVNQITPKYLQPGTTMTSLQDKAISHLNCDNYHNTYDKFNEIANLQKNFNDSMTKFLNKHKNRIRKIVKTENSNPKDESIDMLLRFIFIKSREHDKRPDAVDWELDNFRSFVILINDISEETLEIFNPFLEKENELINYLKKNYEEIIESIETFEGDVIKINPPINEFKNMLPLIVANSNVKGECDSCGKLNDFKTD